MNEQNNGRSSRLPGFYKLGLEERIEKLSDCAELTREEQYHLRHEALSPVLADQMVENVVGVFGLPFGVAVNFQIQGRDYLIPMAVEESSVVAAASHVAKLVREHGRITVSSTDPVMIGQIQIVGAPDPEAARERILQARERILEIANEQDPVLKEVGGGARDIQVRVLQTVRGPMVIAHLLVDVRNAMGANAVNTMAEALSLFLEGLTGGKVLLRIVSNLADRRLARARLEVAPSAFDEHGWKGEEVVEGILNAYAFALADPYRAATHNKGVMNGIDALMVATGNDWRAIEAGAHAYAARSGRYEPLTKWSRAEDGQLIGEIEVPMAVGLIGGATKVHPVAKVALKILGVKSAQELGEVAAAVGLVQNLAAMRSLVTEGIQKGHMSLHARNVAVSAGAAGEAVGQVASQMVREGRIGFDRAKQLLRHALRAAEREVQKLETRLDKEPAKDAPKPKPAPQPADEPKPPAENP
ncbi:MAG: hydroxymethylglutaryl-CoA reductase, degradative [Candidatus Brocadiia bacterium]